MHVPPSQFTPAIGGKAIGPTTQEGTVEGDRLVGTVTDRDIAVRVVAEGKDPEATKVLEIATREVVTIDQKQGLDEALRLMAEHQVRRLPVVEEGGRLVGVLAQADVAQNASSEQTGLLVERISK